MMHELVVPLFRARLEVEADETLTIEIVAGTMSAVVIARRRFDGQIDEAELFVDRDLTPDAGVARGLRRAVEPRAVPRLALLWHRVAGPEAFARARGDGGALALGC